MEKNTPIRLLFVCTVNRMRSATAHHIFETDPRFEVDSAGTDRSADQVLEPWQLNWADIILVMEKYHRDFILHSYPELVSNKKIINLNIPDNYEFMQPELVEILKKKIAALHKRGKLGS